MKTTTFSLIVAAALLAVALPAVAAAPDVCTPRLQFIEPNPPVVCTGSRADVGDVCVNYAYVADYHWYWVCANPKSLDCPVYQKEQHGVSVTRTCVGAGVVGWDPNPVCTPQTGDMDHQFSYCGDVDAGCPVYRVTNGVKTCLLF